MKKSINKSCINYPTNLKQLFNQSTMKKSNLKTSILKILLVTSLYFTTLIAYSQEEKMVTIIQLEQYVSISKNSIKEPKPLRIESLVNEIQSAIYLELDGIKSYGLKPVCLFTSIKNLSKINNLDIKKENIEIVNIRVANFDELSSNIDLSIFSNYKKLKYIYLISDIKCNESDIKKMIKNSEKYIVLYKIAERS